MFHYVRVIMFHYVKVIMFHYGKLENKDDTGSDQSFKHDSGRMVATLRWNQSDYINL